LATPPGYISRKAAILNAVLFFDKRNISIKLLYWRGDYIALIKRE